MNALLLLETVLGPYSSVSATWVQVGVVMVMYLGLGSSSSSEEEER